MPSADADADARRRLSVVLVDDSEEFRFLLRLILRRSDRFDVVAEAGDGRAAVEAARAHRPDVLLLDLNMPVMGGLEALPLIREASPDTRVVVVSGLEAEEMAPVVLGLGAAGYVEKGGSPKEFQAALLDQAGDPGSWNIQTR